jgi:hypothetical protein
MLSERYFQVIVHAHNNFFVIYCLLGRAIYIRLFGEDSLYVSNCDFVLGQIDFRTVHLERAYLWFFKSYFVRCRLLGETHPLTHAAHSMVLVIKSSSGTRLFCGLELKNKIQELSWTESSQSSCQYIIALFISRLDDDTILNTYQLSTLISAALQFFSANYSSVTVSTLPLVTTEEVIQLLSVPAVPRSPPKNNHELFSNPIKREEVDPPLSELSLGKGEAPVVETKDSVMESFSPNQTTEIPSAPATPAITLNLSSPEPNHKNANSNQTNEYNDLNNIVSSPILKTDSHDIILSPKPAMPKTWKPIPPDSPLRHGKLSDFQNQKFSSLISSASFGPRFIRNPKGDLLILTKCQQDTMKKYLRPKMILFALFAWFSKGGSVKSLINKKTRLSLIHPPPAKIVEEKADPKNALNALFGKRGNNPPAGGTEEKVKKEDGSSQNNGKFTRNPPRPPPIPSCWPPVPYVSSAAVGAIGEHSDLVAVLGSAATPKSKYKLIHLSSLPSLEGTFWSEPFDFLVPVFLFIILLPRFHLVYLI